MAISGNTDWEVRTAGDDANGGGFVRGASGTDYSQTDTKRTATGTDDSTTDAVANGTTTITSATANFSTAIVGNIICLQGGTGSLTKTWRQVTSRTNTTTIVVDATVASGTGITMNVGGALASIGMVSSSSAAQSNNVVHVKAGSYSITSSSGGVSGGVVSRNGFIISFIGYQTTRLDMGTPPVFTASGISGVPIITVGAGGAMLANLEINCASLSSMRGVTSSGGVLYRIKVTNATNGGLVSSGISEAVQCEVSGNSGAVGAFSSILSCADCYAHDNTSHGFNQCLRLVRCIADTNTGALSDGFIATSSNCLWVNCVAYGSGRDGFRTAAESVIENCIAENNTAGIGFNGTNTNGHLWRNNAAYNNGTNFTIGTGWPVLNLDSITGSGSFFTNAASGDFSLNNTAGAGALLRETGVPGVFPGGLTTGYLDLGAAQHQGGGGGGGSTASAHVALG